MAGGQTIGLHPSEANGQDVGRGPIPYLMVRNLDSFVEQLRQQHVHIHLSPREVPSGARIATLHDSEGNAIGLYQKAS